MTHYRICIESARTARLGGELHDRDFWLNEAMIARFTMLHAVGTALVAATWECPS